MAFKKYYGQCSKCPTGKTSLIATKNGLCQYHNELKKNRKPKKVKEPKASKMFRMHPGNCSCCEQPGMIVVKAGLRKQCQDKKKQEEKSKRSVKLVNQAEKIKSHPQLKKQLWEVFSEYIRLRDSKDGMFTCISCGKLQSSSGGNLQAGHYYKSETYPALRYLEVQVNGQCLSCNVFKEGNRQGYEIGMIKKYGQATVDMLKLKCHNKAKLGRFELEILIKEFTDKLKQLTHERTKK